MRVVVPLLLVIGLLGACGGDDTVPAPKGVTFQLEQTRQDLQGRKFSVQVVNGGRKDLTVEHLEVESGRLPTSRPRTTGRRPSSPARPSTSR